MWFWVVYLHFVWNLLPVHSKFCVQTRLYLYLCVCSRCVVYSLCSFGNVHLLLCASHRHIHSKYIYMQSYITSLCAVACQKAAAFMWFYVGFFLSLRIELGSNVKYLHLILCQILHVCWQVLYCTHSFAFKRCCIFLYFFSLSSK